MVAAEVEYECDEYASGDEDDNDDDDDDVRDSWRASLFMAALPNVGTGAGWKKAMTRTSIEKEGNSFEKGPASS